MYNGMEKLLEDPRIDTRLLLKSIYGKDILDKFYPITQKTTEYIIKELSFEEYIPSSLLLEFEKTLSKKMFDMFTLGFYCKIESATPGILVDSLKSTNLMKYAKPMSLYVQYDKILDSSDNYAKRILNLCV